MKSIGEYATVLTDTDTLGKPSLSDELHRPDKKILYYYKHIWLDKTELAYPTLLLLFYSLYQKWLEVIASKS